MDSLGDNDMDDGYQTLSPNLELGLPFKPMAASADWFDWPALPNLFPSSFPGVQTGRDAFLVDDDLDNLTERVGDYFNSAIGHEEIARRYPRVMTNTARYDARGVREVLLKRGGPDEVAFVRYAYRPFDIRWLYWEAETKLLREKSPRYPQHVFKGNVWLVAQQKPRREWSPPQVISQIGCLDLMDRSATCIPAWLRDDGIENGDNGERRANLSATAQRYLDRLGLGVEDLFHHVLATLHDPSYREANAGALRMEWPRIPLPGWPDGEAEGAAGRSRPVGGTWERARCASRSRHPRSRRDAGAASTGDRRPSPSPPPSSGRNMAGDDFAVTAGWGHYGQGDAVMPGQGRAAERAFTPEERTAMGDTLPALGATTFDIHLNDRAYWRSVPAAVWTYRLGGYQVLKKWLSYRERDILRRKLKADEVQYFTDTARRIAAILCLADSADKSFPA